jgi:hypothetical protein
MKIVNPYISTGNSLTYASKKTYSISLLPKLMELAKTTRLAQANAIRTAGKEQEFFSGLSGDIASDIALLHKRYRQYPYIIDRMQKDVENILGDEAYFHKCLTTAILRSGMNNPRKYIDDGQMAWADVASYLVEIINAVKTNNTDINNFENAGKIKQFLLKLTKYDDTKSSITDFIRNYFFGGFGTPFQNILLREKIGLIKDYTQLDKTLFNPNVYMSDFDNDDNAKDTFEERHTLTALIPISHEFGFDIEEVGLFLNFWNRLPREEQVDLVYRAIKESSNENLRELNVSKEMVAGAYVNITAGIGRAEQIVKSINQNPEGRNLRTDIKKLGDILTNDFIFRATLDNMSSQVDNIETQKTDDDSATVEDLLAYNRHMFKDIQEKNYPVLLQKTAVFQDPFGLRAILNSPILDEAIKTPKVAFSSHQHLEYLTIYLTCLAMLNADSVYDYVSGAGGRKSKELSFDSTVIKYIRSEIPMLFKNQLNDAQIAQLTHHAVHFYHQADNNKKRYYRNFLNLLQRDLATTHAIYESGYKWGELTPEQINEVANKVYKAVYPFIKEYNSRRQFKVVDDKTQADKQRSTMVVPGMDYKLAFNLIQQEISNKNKAVAQAIGDSQNKANAEQVDLDSIVKTVQFKLGDLSAKRSDYTNFTVTPSQPVQAQKLHGYNNSIKFGSTPKPDVVNEIYLKWLIKN